MLRVNQLIGFGRRKITPVTATYVTKVSSTSDLVTYTFNATSIGAETDSTRMIVVTCTYRASGTVSTNGITIDTLSMFSGVGNSNTSGGATTGSSVYRRRWPTGTTANIVVTQSGTTARLICGIYSVTGLVGDENGPPMFDNGTSTGGDPTEDSIVIPRYGCYIGCAHSNGNNTATWSPAAVTNDFEDLLESATRGTSGHISNQQNEQLVTAGVAWSGSPTVSSLSHCTFGNI